MGRRIDPERQRNEPLKLLICQCLNIEELKSGSFTEFAKLFTEFSGVVISRHNIMSWLNCKGVPPDRCKAARDLSRKYARRSKIHKQIISLEKLRPDIFL